jgi:hypothetical protein
VIIRDSFQGGLLLYLGYWCHQVDFDPISRECDFHFEISDWSYAEILDAWNSPEGQAVSDIRQYVQALKRLQHLQKRARQNIDHKFVDPAWISGKRNKEAEEK